MDTCSICLDTISGPRLGDGDDAVHASCLADQLPQDAVVALGGLLALLLAPAILIWAA